jgi:hypothetical protein
MAADVRALARTHTPQIIAELARLALNSESDNARVAAIKELLDRGWGKPGTQESPEVVTPYEFGPKMAVDPLTKPNGNGRAAINLSEFRKIG